MWASRFVRRVVGAVCLLVLSVSTPAGAAKMGWYLPLQPGASWTYANTENPLDTYTDTVFEVIEYQGNPAYRVGDIDDHVIAYLDDGVVTVYAFFDAGVLVDLDPDIVLDEIVDGDIFEVCEGAFCDSSLIRVWSEMDPSLRNIYGMDPEFTDMLLFASYDPDYEPNLQNVVVESNLPEGVTPPAGAVTGLEWYLRGVGTLATWDVDAESGGLGVHYELVTVSAADPSPPPAPVVMLEAIAPNPFNPRTTIRYRMREAGFVAIGVYDLAGRRVRMLADHAWQTAGPQSVVFDGRGASGELLASGVYLCRIVAGRDRVTGKFSLLR